MSSREKDEIINRFIYIAKCPRHMAIEYLENARWNEDLALGFFLDAGESHSIDSIDSSDSDAWGNEFNPQSFGLCSLS